MPGTHYTNQSNYSTRGVRHAIVGPSRLRIKSSPHFSSASSLLWNLMLLLAKMVSRSVRRAAPADSRPMRAGPCKFHKGVGTPRRRRPPSRPIVSSSIKPRTGCHALGFGIWCLGFLPLRLSSLDPRRSTLPWCFSGHWTLLLGVFLLIATPLSAAEFPGKEWPTATPVVVPSLDLVVARAGPSKSWKRDKDADHYEVLKPFLQPIAAAVPVPIQKQSSSGPRRPVIKESRLRA